MLWYDFADQHSTETTLKAVFVKAYVPYSKKSVQIEMGLYEDDDEPIQMLCCLRRTVGLPADGPGQEVVIWRETGANSQPNWTPLVLDWNVRSWGQLGVAHGDLLVIQ